MTELKYQDLVDKIDPTLMFEHHYAGYDVYRVTQGKTPRILKFIRKSPIYKCVGDVIRCVIPKLFHKADLISFMKLNKSKLLETLKRLNNGATAYQARKVANIDIQKFFRSRDGKTVKLIELGHAVLEGNPTYGEYRRIDLSRLRNYD